MIVFLPALVFSKDDMMKLNESIEALIAKKKIEKCVNELNKTRAELFNTRVKLELEKIRHTRDVKLLEYKTGKLTDRVYNFAFLTFIGFSFGLYAFRKRRDE
jgi:hypothetical protein